MILVLKFGGRLISNFFSHRLNRLEGFFSPEPERYRTVEAIQEFPRIKSVQSAKSAGEKFSHRL